MPRFLSCSRPLLRWCTLLAAGHLSGAGVARADYPLSTAMLTGADEDVREHTPADTSGGRAFLELRSRSIAGTERHTIDYLRFDLHDLTGPLPGVSLSIWAASSQGDTDAFSIDVYGVPDGVPGESDWSATGLSYNNAPGMGAADMPDTDRDLDPARTVFLGTLAYPGSRYSGSLTFSSQALTDFLNADTNDAVTLILEPQVAADGEDFFIHVRTAEGVGSDPGDTAPTLILSDVLPPPPPPPPPAGVVILTDSGSTVTLGNGIVSAVFSKTTGVCSDLRRTDGTNLLRNGGRLYFDSNSGSSYYPFSGTYSLVEHTAQRAHLMLSGRMGEFTAELHYVLEAPDSGIHCYTVFRHGAGDAATYLEQARMVLRCDKNVFTRAFTSEEKAGQMIAPELLAAAPVIMDATHELPAVSTYTTPTGISSAGLPVYTKYDWADFMETHKAHGLSGDTAGLWMITGSGEFMNGGPTKGELFLHGTETTPLIIATFHAGHFIGAEANVPMAADEVWEKVCGPYFIYLNAGTSADALWQDALRQAAAEKAAWPLAWMQEAGYPLARGTVTGQVLADGAPAVHALIVLAQPGQDWQTQGRDYLFWTRTDDTGHFLIPQVRPGSYSLYGAVPGISGELERSGVTVNAGTTRDVGRLSWTPPRRTRTLWQIGTPDRSSAEFRYGGEMRQHGLWWRYLQEQGTADLDYTTGISTPADWYYAQSVVALDTGAYLSPVWKVHFPLSSVPGGPGELILDFAGQMNGTLKLALNGTAIASVPTTNDAGLYRSATRLSRYRQERITVSTSLLRSGTNTLTFQMSGHPDWSGTRPASPASGVMYDAIRFEAGAAIPEILTTEYRLEVCAGPGGTVSGGGYFTPGTSAEIQALAADGYAFSRWSDGGTEPLRTVTVTGNSAYSASFSAIGPQEYADWAAAHLPADADRTFGGDADQDGIPNGFVYAYGPLPESVPILSLRSIAGQPTAVFTLTPEPAGETRTLLRVEATRDLHDWTAGAVALAESTLAGERRWTPVTPAPRVFFRAVLTLVP